MMATVDFRPYVLRIGRRKWRVGPAPGSGAYKVVDEIPHIVFRIRLEPVPRWKLWVR